MQPFGKGGKMKHWKVISVILVFIGITWTGCTRDLYNVQDTPVPSFKDRSLSLEEVKNAIMRSKGTSYVRYEMHDIEPGLIRCQLKFKKNIGPGLTFLTPRNRIAYNTRVAKTSDSNRLQRITPPRLFTGTIIPGFETSTNPYK